MKSQWFQLAAWMAASSAAFAQTSVQRPDLPRLLDQWRAAHGEGWRYHVDGGTGHLEMLYGARVAPEFTPQSDAEWFTLARQVLADTQAMHGIAGTQLVEENALFLPLGQVGTSDKMTVRFRQELHGVPVDGGFVNVLFDAAGGLLSVQERALPIANDFNTRPALTANTGTEFATVAFSNDFRGRTPTTVNSAGLVIAQVDGAEQRVPVLAWKVAVLSEDIDLGPVGKTYWIDAKTGAVAKSENAIQNFDVGGTVTSLAVVDHFPDEPGHTATPQPMRYARLTSSAGTTFTDANGNFNYVGASGPLNITCTYVGTYNQVNNSAGSPYSLVFPAVTGSGNNIVMNSPQATLVTSQSNIFYAVNIQRDFIRSINPSDTHADFVHTANVNIASTCNAFYNGTSINFYQAGGGCTNTGFPNVCYHENGHWMNDKYSTGNGSDGMGEGNADVWAMYIEDDPIVGHDFCGSNCNVRNGLNTTLFCGDASPGCYGEVHTDGEPWMGAAWKIRRNLKNALGTSAGGATANSLFLGWMNTYNQTQIKSIIETQWLTLDDNNGNINDGTPNYAAIDGGFVEQGFPGFPLQFINITNVVSPGTTTNQAGPYNIDADISANFGNSVSTATVRWRIGSSGAFASQPMSVLSGNTWRGSIPGPITAPAKVYFYLQATDTAAHTATLPANAPTGKLSFGIGTSSTTFCDNFDVAGAWTVTNTSVTTGAWERGVPIGTAAQPSTDNPSGTGTQCYFTDQGAVGGAVGDADVDGGPTVLTSPVLDMSAGNGEISYAYWMYNDDGDDSLLVQVSNNGSTWVTAKSYQGGVGGWFSDVIDVGAWIVPNATVRVRFSVADNPNNSITEAAVDDVCASVLGPVSCPSASFYCTAKVNSLGCTPAIATSGTASASSATPFNISASQVLNNKTGLLFYGFGQNNAPFQGGTMCVQTPVQRTPIQISGGNAGPDDCSGVFSFDFNTRIQGGTDPLLVTGATVDAEYYYRDPASSFTVGLSNAVQFQVCP